MLGGRSAVGGELNFFGVEGVGEEEDFFLAAMSHALRLFRFPLLVLFIFWWAWCEKMM
jgi:hypothetical protein